MKHIYKLISIIIFTLFFYGCNLEKQIAKKELQNEIDSLSYCIGISLATNMNEFEPDLRLNPMIVSKAIIDYEKKDIIIDNEKGLNYISTYFSKEEMKIHEKTIKEGEKFLEANSKKQGVVTTNSGLQYKILTQGIGTIPTKSSKVEVNYEGKLINGKKFDSSYDRKKSATFNLQEVIKGWTEILQIMPVGSTYEVYIPYNLAYGSKKIGNDIPPYSTLIFKIELLSIKN